MAMKMAYSTEELQSSSTTPGTPSAGWRKTAGFHRLYGLPGVWYRAEDVLDLCEFKEPKHSDEEYEALVDECIRLKNEISELRRLENVQIAACGGDAK